jgi:hypothetical protein
MKSGNSKKVNPFLAFGPFALTQKFVSMVPAYPVGFISVVNDLGTIN